MQPYNGSGGLALVAARARLVERAALILITATDVVAVNVGESHVTVEDRSGRALRLTVDLTVLLNTGLRAGILVAPRVSLAAAVDWPARVISPPVEASAARVLFTMTRMAVVKHFGDDSRRHVNRSVRVTRIGRRRRLQVPMSGVSTPASPINLPLFEDPPN